MHKKESVFMVLVLFVCPVILGMFYPLCEKLFPNNGKLAAGILSGTITIIVLHMLLRLPWDKNTRKSK
ncbi:MAG: hypothetical protein GX410_11415 [Elusimicrobia bacterium]|nr:hypothetical protein [Elusimicrobiota bacterium]